MGSAMSREKNGANSEMIFAGLVAVCFALGVIAGAQR